LIEAKPRAEELVAAAEACRVDVSHLAGGNHYFQGKEAELGTEIVNWLGDRRP
jgi:hypothetical protein